mmetsp:Transcript_2623/g.9196  ORF Transcript_2623/g.9196 Transcript_2623/m.9196 type:complete len:253 (+) Transcript_2623:1428-2186(+)
MTDAGNDQLAAYAWFMVIGFEKKSSTPFPKNKSLGNFRAAETLSLPRNISAVVSFATRPRTAAAAASVHPSRASAASGFRVTCVAVVVGSEVVEFVAPVTFVSSLCESARRNRFSLRRELEELEIVFSVSSASPSSSPWNKSPPQIATIVRPTSNKPTAASTACSFSDRAVGALSSAATVSIPRAAARAVISDGTAAIVATATISPPTKSGSSTTPGSSFTMSSVTDADAMTRAIAPALICARAAFSSAPTA